MCANLVATARPIPREAPVTMTLLVVDAPAIISYSPWVQGDRRGLSDAETRPGYDRQLYFLLSNNSALFSKMYLMVQSPNILSLSLSSFSNLLNPWVLGSFASCLSSSENLTTCNRFRISPFLLIFSML
jgi:hypothetical protein